LIKVYSTPICAACVALKATLTSAGVEYESFDLTDNLVAAASVMEASGIRTAPIIHDIEADRFYTGKEYLSENFGNPS